MLRILRGAEDRRQVHCSITPAGLALLEELDEIVQAVDDKIFAGHSSREVAQLIQLLDGVATEEP